MTIRKMFVVVALLSTVAPAFAWYEVECEGYDDDTSAYVEGTCTDGEFEGYDSETGEYVYGDCEFDGDLDAYNSETDEHVSGECEGD